MELQPNTNYSLSFYYEYYIPYTSSSGNYSECIFTITGDDYVLAGYVVSIDQKGYFNLITPVSNANFNVLKFELSQCTLQDNLLYIDEVTLKSVNDQECAFIIQMTAVTGSTNTTFDGQFLQLNDNSGYGYQVLIATENADNATEFLFDTDGYLRTVDELEFASFPAEKYGKYYGQGYPMQFDASKYLYSSEYENCGVTETSGLLTLNCISSGQYAQPYYCSIPPADEFVDNYLTFGNPDGYWDCYPYNLNVIYINQ